MSELPELLEVIRGERRGGYEMPREQVKEGRQRLFDEVERKRPDGVLRRRTFEVLLK